MAPLAKPMVPQSHGSVMSLARSSSLEGSTISDHLRSEGPGADRRGGGAGQVGRMCTQCALFVGGGATVVRMCNGVLVSGVVCAAPVKAV